MRTAWGVASIGAAAVLIGGLSAAPVSAVPTTVAANYQMEADGAGTTMTDSSPNGLDGTIDAAHAAAGLDTHAPTDGGNFGYQWTAVPPTPNDARVVTVPDNASLEPGNNEFAVEVKLKTSAASGTLVQKGLPDSVGGHWRVQLVGGKASCLFRSDTVQGGISSSTLVNNGQWHTIKCELTATGTTVYVDGAKDGHQNKAVAGVDNAAPVTVGGKVGCATVGSCDYYVGFVDSIRILKGGALDNLPPVAKFTPDCAAQDGTCTFATTGTDDPDGTVDLYEWDWTNNGSWDDTGAGPISHNFVNPGTYTVKLRVTDNDGATDSAVHTVDVVTGDPPSRPRQVTATAGDASVKLTWLKSSTGNDGVITGYTATATPGGNTCSTGISPPLGCTVNGLTPGTAYTFRVRADSTVGPGDQSQQAGPVTPFGKPSAPGKVAAKAGNHRATVTWTAANPNGKRITRYVVTRLPGGVTKAVDATARKTVFRKLKNGKAYHFTVAAVNAAGRGPAKATGSVTPVGPPTKVANVTARAGSKSALISWAAAKPNGSPILHYKIVSDDGQHRVVGAAARQVRIKFLQSGHSYRFRVRAINKIGEGPWSAWTRSVTVH